MVLGWIAASGERPWFPSAHARDTGVPRDSLDEPLTELRLAGLVRIAEWVRGAGQGYVVTPEGEIAAKDPASVDRLRPAPHPAPEPPPAVPNETATGPAPPARPPEENDLRPPFVTLALIAANLLWFFVGLIIAVRSGISVRAYLTGDAGEVLHRLGAVTAPDLLAGQWWRLLSACFVHVTWYHILLNLFFFGTVGSLAELVWGRWRLGVIYLLSGLAGSCLAMALRPIDADTGAAIPLAGASGAICGVLAALLAWVLLFWSRLPADVARELLRRLVLALVLTAAISFVPGLSVSWEGHLGGAVVGFLTAGLLNALRFGDRARKVSAVVLLVALPALCVGGLVAAMESGDSWEPLRAARRAEEARAAARAAADEYNREVVPLLLAVKPAAVGPVEHDAELVIVRGTGRRPDAVAAIRARVDPLRAAAVDAVAKLSGPPTGVEEVDRKRAKARAFTEARVKSFDLLLGLLAGPDDPAALDAWIESRREAERLWADLGQK
ncbi:MAG TPA: rhomboid family intramembrane serine protease [Gemmataceae bacterium]|nr:rhomboid family intramembrane serine protease [Gemmataceae bacterium]